MVFGSVMQMNVGELTVELAPITRDDVPRLIDGGFWHHTTTQYLPVDTAFTLEDEYEWYEKTRQNQQAITWGIFVVKNGERRLIGNTSLMDIHDRPVAVATTGIVLTDRAYWGKGIASATHKARTWYAFRQRGLIALNSRVLSPNRASQRAIESVGYVYSYTSRNEKFVNGGLIHAYHYQLVNPDEWAWSQWWGDDQPSAEASAARQKTQQILSWADSNVELK